MPGYSSRRSFITTAAAGGSVLASKTAGAKSKKQYKRKSPASNELIEVGMLSTGGYSHADVWGKAMNPPLEEFRGGFLPRLTGMVMTMCWDPDPERAEAFGKKFGVKVVKNYYDMVDRVDGIITADYDITGWMPQLSKPYLEAGMPILIERPMALSLREAKEIIERSKKFNAPIYVPSAYETRFETIRARAKLKKLLDEGAYITGVVATQAARDYPAHGTHGIYKLYTILNPDVIAAGLLSDDWWGFNSAVMTWKCQQGDHPDYYVGLQFSSDGWTIINTSKGQIQENIDLTSDDPYSRAKWHNTPNVHEFAIMVETGKMPQSHEYIMAKTTTLLTGFYSHLEKNGNLVNCADLPETWRAPDRFTGRTFKNHRDPAALDELFG
jgi:hypothetical protein